MIFHTPSSDSRGWKGSCLFGTQFGFQTQKVTVHLLAAAAAAVERDPSPSNSHTCAPGVSTHPAWPPSEEIHSTAQHIPTPLTKEKEIQGFKCQNNELEHVTLTFWRTAFSLCLQQFRWLPREVGVYFPKPIRYQVSSPSRITPLLPPTHSHSPHKTLQRPPIASVIKSKDSNMAHEAMAIWPLPGPQISSSPLALWVAATLDCLSGPLHFQEGSSADHHMTVYLS